MAEHQREPGLDREDGLGQMLVDVALHIVQTVVGRDIQELIVRDILIVDQQGGLDDGEDVQHGAREEAGGLEDLGPLDQDAVVAEVIVVNVPDTHPQELRGHTEVLPDAGREQSALGGEVKLVLRRTCLKCLDEAALRKVLFKG